MQKSCFRSKVEVLRARPSKRSGDVVLYSQNVHFCYCMRALLLDVFFAFAAKLYFVCIFTVYLVPPS